MFLRIKLQTNNLSGYIVVLHTKANKTLEITTDLEHFIQLLLFKANIFEIKSLK